ncbi:MAG: GFA family protein [Pseudomonas sp.]|uniref:GFA family protein n=1 Tax=Pseudomonas sp. TaxID=306 RepID=UPI003981C34E
MHQGGCLCGAVRYQVEGELAPIQICHCSQCRKAQGSAFVTNIPVQESAFALLSGAEQLKAYESSPGKQRVFCGNCGSPIYSCTSKLPGVLRIRAGSLEGDLATRPGWHAFTASRANWWDIHDDLPQSPAFKP